MMNEQQNSAPSPNSLGTAGNIDNKSRTISTISSKDLTKPKTRANVRLISDSMKVSTVTELATMMQTLISKLDEKIDMHYASHDRKIESISNELNEKIDAITAEFNSNCVNIRDDMNSKLAESDSKHTKRTVDLENNFLLLHSQLDVRLNNIERRNNQSDLMIYGIPTLKSENVSRMVSDICTKLGADPSSVIAAFRIASGKSRFMPIVVKFSSINCKQHILRRYLEFKNLMLSDINIEFDGETVNRRIFINECLTKDDNILFKKANVLRKEGKLFKVSTRNGHVVVKKTAADEFVNFLLSDLESMVN